MSDTTWQVKPSGELSSTAAKSDVRLSIACGLDKIPSSVWRKPPVFNAAIHFTLRAGGFALEPPEDAIDLGERIHAL